MRYMSNYIFSIIDWKTFFSDFMVSYFCDWVIDEELTIIKCHKVAQLMICKLTVWNQISKQKEMV